MTSAVPRVRHKHSATLQLMDVRNSREVIDLARNDDAEINAVPSSCGTGVVLQALMSTFEELRSEVLCKICFGTLYEPYTIACGHTYCYTCLCQWFASNGKKKTCPDCRASVQHPPAPAYGYRNITRKLLQRPELLPDGETLDQHEQRQKEEADAVELDRQLPAGLFRGMFKARASVQHLIPLHDEEDGVDRCPRCAWELEDTLEFCERCGYNRGPDEEDSDESEYDGDESVAANEGHMYPEIYGLDNLSDFEDTDEELDEELELDVRDGDDGFSDEDSDMDGPEQDVAENASSRLQELAQSHGGERITQISEVQSHRELRGRPPRRNLRTRIPLSIAPMYSNASLNTNVATVQEDREDVESNSTQDDTSMTDCSSADESDTDSDDTSSTPRQVSHALRPRTVVSLIDSEDDYCSDDANSDVGDEDSDEGSDERSDESSDEGGAISNGIRRRLAALSATP